MNVNMGWSPGEDMHDNFPMKVAINYPRGSSIDTLTL